MLSEESELNQTVDFDAPKRKKSKKFNAEEFIYAYRIPLTLLLLGAILIGAGIIFAKSSFFEEPKIEVLESSSEIAPAEKELVVELAGSVEKPGVYKVAASSRVEDLLILAGGLSASADRNWVETNLNRAAKLTDGQKIYIPKQGEVQISTQTSSVSGFSTQIISINTASSSQLESLWGIGESRAASIIENRPYSDINELLTKKVIPGNVFEKIKAKISI